jgi:hypothetical protein
MTRILLVLPALFSFLAACGGATSSSPGAAPASGALSTAATGGILTLGEVAFFAGDSQPGLTLGSEGRVEMEGRHLGTLSADGTFATADGEMVATLHPDGRLVVVGNESQDIVVSAEGELTINDRTVHFDDEGNLSGAVMAGPSIRAEGLTAETRRAAMVILVLMLMPRAAEPPVEMPLPSPEDSPATSD